jgi:NAD(P)-dependent dehydrogenase (short-subunit alcohol dehydrogenase family)
VPRVVLTHTPTVRWEVPTPDLTGCVVLITGATVGLGLASVRGLGAAGAEVVMVARRTPRAIRAAYALRRVVPDGAFRVEYADLADLESVRELAGRLLHQNRPLSRLINNADVATTGERRLSRDGFELQFAVNHLAPFALTGLLLPLLQLAEHPRVVSVSSLAAVRARIDFCDLQRVHHHGGAYAQSKLAQLMFTRELDRRSRSHQWGISAVAAHPGSATAATATARGGRLGKAVGSAQSAAEGALPVLLAATDPFVQSGDYYAPQRRRGLSGPPGPTPMPHQVSDAAATRLLWERSEELTGVVWPRA